MAGCSSGEAAARAMNFQEGEFASRAMQFMAVCCFRVLFVVSVDQRHHVVTRGARACSSPLYSTQFADGGETSGLHPIRNALQHSDDYAA